MKVLSLFDGMACGYLAMQKAGVEVEAYHAYEIDKYAVKTARHNFPDIQEHGDVFTADFTVYRGLVDFLVGGSPCTYWSIAQTKNRETEASGLGWDLFSQYVRALHEAQPKFFVYENNKSMAKAIRDQIRETFGFEEICINSALVSAQNRQRFYWVGKRNEDGTYSKVDVQQPEDLGILLKDVLDGAERVPSYGPDDKSRPVRMSYAYKGAGEGSLRTEAFPDNPAKQVSDYAAVPVPFRQTIDGKGFCLDASYTKTPGSPATFLEGGHARANRSMAAEPVPFNPTVDGKSHTLTATYYKISGVPVSNYGDEKARPRVAEPVRVGCMPSPDGTLKNSQANRVYSPDGKSVNLLGQGGGAGAKTGLYAIPVEWDSSGIPTKATSGADGKTYTVYPVQDGQIVIKEKTYPIKLVDGYYIIRKLTVSECKRLQTVPEWYDFSCVSNSQAYKMLGNGWTVDVIAHLIKSCLVGV